MERRRFRIESTALETEAEILETFTREGKIKLWSGGVCGTEAEASEMCSFWKDNMSSCSFGYLTIQRFFSGVHLMAAAAPEIVVLL